MSHEQDYFVNVVNATPIPVTLGSENITITGSVNVGSTVSVISSPENPVHVHVTEAPPALVTENSNYHMNVVRGLVPGQAWDNINGYNPDCSQDTEESIWWNGGIYPWDSWTTAQKLYFISTSASDANKTVYIEGLNSSYIQVSETVTLGNLTAVATTNNFIRIRRAVVTSASSNSPNDGDITARLVSGTGTVVAHIGAGVGRTKLGQYTVPAGKTAYIMFGDATSFRGGSGNIGTQVRMCVRPYGQAFTAAHLSEVVNGFYRCDFTVPIPVTEKSDIDIRCIADGNNTKFSCNYQVILVNN